MTRFEEICYPKNLSKIKKKALRKVPLFIHSLYSALLTLFVLRGQSNIEYKLGSRHLQPNLAHFDRFGKLPFRSPFTLTIKISTLDM